MIVLVFFTVSSCYKGRTLWKKVNVHFVNNVNCFLSPEGEFDPFDSDNPLEGTHPSNYVGSLESSSVKNGFNDEFKEYMKNNNVILTSDSSEYEVHITYMGMKEELHRSEYMDSCTGFISYVYYSSLEFKAKASLYKHGVLIDSWQRSASSMDKVRDKRNNCNKPKIRDFWGGPQKLWSKVAKKLRAVISRKIYQLEK